MLSQLQQLVPQFRWQCVPDLNSAADIIGEGQADVILFAMDEAPTIDFQHYPALIVLSQRYDESEALTCTQAGAHLYIGMDRLDAYTLITAVTQTVEYIRLTSDLNLAVQVLGQENSRFRTAIENLSMGVSISDPNLPDNPIIFVNPGFTTITGYKPHEVIGRTYQLLQGPGTDPVMVEQMRAAVRECKPFTGVVLNYHRSGLPFWNELTINPVYDERGNLINFVGLMNDVTERRLAEEWLSEYTERLQILRAIDRAILSAHSLETIAQTVIDHVQKLVVCAHLSVITVDMEAHSAEVLAMYSDEPQNSLLLAGASIPFDEIDVTGAMRQGLVRRVDKVEEQRGTSMLARALHEEGVQGYVAIPLVARGELIGMFNVGGGPGQVFTSEQIELVREVTAPLAVAMLQMRLYRQIQDYAALLEHRVAQRTAELRQSEERAAAILKNTSDAIIMTDAQGKIMQINPAFTMLFGYNEAETIGQVFEMLVDGMYREQLKLALDEIVTGSTQQRLEIVALRKDRAPFAADMALVPVIDHESQQRHVVYSVRDISERKAMEENLRDALHRERELHELKSRFISMVSHEFRTPLAIIQSSSDMIKRYHHRLSHARRMEYLTTIQGEVTALTELLDDILTMGMAQTVGLPFNPTEFNFEEFCLETHDSMQRAIKSSSQDIIFTSENASITVLMDKKLLRQILVNLLTNALKYSPPSSRIYFHVYSNGTEITVTVRDQGIGIPEEDQKRLFEIFHRSRNVGTIPGTGLGLAIAKQAVELHGGHISFESTVGTGTVFTVRLPVRTAVIQEK